MPMSSNDSKSILDSLLRTAQDGWGISQDQIIENMEKVFNF